MRDPLTWSLPLGRMFGITVRVHVLFPLLVIALVGRIALSGPDKYLPYTWVDVSVVLGLLFVSVLLHEFGHCFAGRWVDGDAQEILLWPLGGLAYVEVPHTPRANFIMVAGGPAVNAVLCLICGVILLAGYQIWPPLNPFNINALVRTAADGSLTLTRWGGESITVSAIVPILLARFFWVNWASLLINVLLIGFPLDGGRLFQCILWRYVGYRQATLAAIFAGFLTMLVVGVFSIAVNEVLPLCLAAFIYVSCRQQWILLETGGEESIFGYDFSQGYTSLEREHAGTSPPSLPRRRQSWLQRWLQRRAARRRLREQEEREREEERMDELLKKVQLQGLPALTEEERRFLKRVSDRYRNRN